MGGNAGILGVGRVYQEGSDKNAIEERVLKLHNNASQNRVDLYSGVRPQQPLKLSMFSFAGASTLRPAAHC